MSRFSVRDDLRSEDQIFDGDRQIELSEVVDLLNGSIPDRYTPREEVTEGWWSARRVTGKKRVPAFRVTMTEPGLRADVGEMIWTLDYYTDFLPVPAWLVEGIK